MWQRMAALSVVTVVRLRQHWGISGFETVPASTRGEGSHGDRARRAVQRVDNVSQVYRHVAQEQMGLKAQAENQGTS